MSAAQATERPRVGAKVGAKRWPNTNAHPGNWGKPWAGVVLAITNPRAWENTLAFSGRRPGRREVREHVARHDFSDRVPVLWDFGAHGFQVYWEHVASVRAYDEDVADWERARAEYTVSFEATVRANLERMAAEERMREERDAAERRALEVSRGQAA